MNYGEIFLIALALSLDAFSAAVSCGMKLSRKNYAKFLKIAGAFGLFQAIMPLLGATITHALLRQFIANYAHIIGGSVFALLASKTFYDYFTDRSKTEKCHCPCQNNRCLLILAVATSIDALLIGSVLGLREYSLIIPITIIGIVTFVLSLLGVFIGNYSLTMFNVLRSQSRILAGLILTVLAFASFWSGAMR